MSNRRRIALAVIALAAMGLLAGVAWAQATRTTGTAEVLHYYYAPPQFLEMRQAGESLHIKVLNQNRWECDDDLKDLIQGKQVALIALRINLVTDEGTGVVKWTLHPDAVPDGYWEGTATVNVLSWSEGQIAGRSVAQGRGSLKGKKLFVHWSPEDGGLQHCVVLDSHGD
jgi:hypothetical protein